MPPGPPRGYAGPPPGQRPPQAFQPPPKRPKVALIIGLVVAALVVGIATVVRLSGGSGGGGTTAGAASGEGEVGQKVAAEETGRGNGRGFVTVLGVEWKPGVTKSKRVTVGIEVQGTNKDGLGNNGHFCVTADGQRITSGSGPEPQFPGNFRVPGGKTVRGLLTFDLDRQQECFLGLHLQSIYTKIRIPAENAGQPLRGFAALDVPAKAVGEPYEVRLEDGDAAMVTVDRFTWGPAEPGRKHDELTLFADVTIVGAKGRVPVRLGQNFVVYAPDRQTKTRPVDVDSPDLDRELAPGEKQSVRVQASIPRVAGVRLESKPDRFMPQAQIAVRP